MQDKLDIILCHLLQTSQIFIAKTAIWRDDKPVKWRYVQPYHVIDACEHRCVAYGQADCKILAFTFTAPTYLTNTHQRQFVSCFACMKYHIFLLIRFLAFGSKSFGRRRLRLKTTGFHCELHSYICMRPGLLHYAPFPSLNQLFAHSKCTSSAKHVAITM